MLGFKNEKDNSLILLSCVTAHVFIKLDQL